MRRHRRQEDSHPQKVWSKLRRQKVRVDSRRERSAATKSNGGIELWSSSSSDLWIERALPGFFKLHSSSFPRCGLSFWPHKASKDQPIPHTIIMEWYHDQHFFFLLTWSSILLLHHIKLCIKYVYINSNKRSNDCTTYLNIRKKRQETDRNFKLYTFTLQE